MVIRSILPLLSAAILVTAVAPEFAQAYCGSDEAKEVAIANVKKLARIDGAKSFTGGPIVVEYGSAYRYPFFYVAENSDKMMGVISVNYDDCEIKDNSNGLSEEQSVD